MTFAQFKSKWLGKRVDTDGIPKGRPYQCVDLIKQGLKEMHGIPYGSYGDAIDYWYNTAPAIARKFEKLKTSAGKEGDIVILNGINGNADGHIGWSTGRNSLPGYTEILEQNGHGSGLGVGSDAIRTRWIPRYRVVGVLRKRVVSTTVYHTVVSGDSLSKLASVFKTTVKQLQAWNKAKYPSLATNPNYIRIGWKLRVK